MFTYWDVHTVAIRESMKSDIRRRLELDLSNRSSVEASSPTQYSEDATFISPNPSPIAPENPSFYPEAQSRSLDALSMNRVHFLRIWFLIHFYNVFGKLTDLWQLSGLSRNTYLTKICETLGEEYASENTATLCQHPEKLPKLRRIWLNIAKFCKCWIWTGVEVINSYGSWNQ